LARKTRVFVKDVPQYISLATDAPQSMLLAQGDYDFFYALIKELVEEFKLPIHAYILLPQSFEFLATPYDKDVLSRFMQKLARRYIVYFSKKYNHTGSLWRRRYTSVLVDGDEYLYDVIFW